MRHRNTHIKLNSFHITSSSKYNIYLLLLPYVVYTDLLFSISIRDRAIVQIQNKMATKQKQKICLAYSGGLDTSCILKYLLEAQYTVVCFLANVGQEEDWDAVREKAMKYAHLLTSVKP